MSWLAAATLGSGVLGWYGQKQANDATARSVGNQIEFQRYMSNTAYQRAMADMRKAGLNPMLAYKMGGASTPQGAHYVAQNEFGAGINAANQTANTITSARQQASQQALNETQIKKINQEIDKIIPAQANLLAQQAKQAGEYASKAKIEGELIKLKKALTQLDVNAYKELTKQLGISMGPDAAKTAVAAFAAASQSLKGMFDMFKAIMPSKMPEFLKRWAKRVGIGNSK